MTIFVVPASERMLHECNSYVSYRHNSFVNSANYFVLLYIVPLHKAVTAGAESEEKGETVGG